MLELGGISSAIPSAAAPASNSGNALTDFASILDNAMSGTVETDAADKLSNIALMTGEDVNLHDITIAAQKADIALSLTVRIQNKVIDAYTEIMRMQV